VRIAALVVTALLGVASGIAATEGDTPIDSVTSVVSSLGGQTTVVSGIVSTSSEAVGGAASSGTSGSSATGAGGGKTAPLAASMIKTTFDRLPRRFEVLLERIELGQKVRANMQRLERALEAARPSLRARVLRLVRTEIRRLEHGGLMPVQRPRLNRLRRVVTALTQPDGATANASDGAALPGQLGDRPADISPGRGTPNSTSPGSPQPFTGSGSPSSSPSKADGLNGGDRDVGGFGSRLDLPPDWESGVQFGVYAALFAVLALGLIALLLAAVPPDTLPRRLRRFAQTSRLALGVTGAATLIGLALILLV
jgi:hypothetical protein